MKKNERLNIKLINILIIVATICLLYLIRALWLGIVDKIFAIIAPFIIAFAIAYALYPISAKLKEIGLPKWLSILIICFIGFGICIICLVLIVPILYEQTLLFLSNISAFLSDIANKYEINLGVLQSSLSDTTTNIISNVGKYISDGAINIVNASVGLITSVVITIFVSIYMLIDMDKIRLYIKDNLLNKNKKIYNYIKKLDEEITNYFNGLGKVILVQLIEYTFAFFIIGHPNYLILGILAAITTIIPYFGALIVNIMAVLIASVISTKLLILTLIVCIVCPQLDGYVISPRIYGKTNQLHPLVIIFAVFAGGIIGGFWGVVVSMPAAIVLITTYKYFRIDINKKITKMKGKEK